MDGLKHEFIFMPLAFTMQSEKTSQLELNKTKAWDMVPGQVFAKYEVYKALAMIENEKNYPGQLAGLPDPSLLAVSQQTSIRIFLVALRASTLPLTQPGLTSWALRLC